VKQPIDESGVKLTLKTTYNSDGYHYSFFFDEMCPAITPVLYDAPNVVKDKVYEEFDSIRFDDPLASQIHLKIYGTLRIFDGEYRFDAIKYLEISK
jgi:hypothetical protein